MRASTSWLLLPALALLAGCHHATQYQPEYVARGELTLRYDDGFQIYAGNEMLAESPVQIGPGGDFGEAVCLGDITEGNEKLLVGVVAVVCQMGVQILCGLDRIGEGLDQ